MSACIFMEDVSKLNESELHHKKRELIGFLGKNDNPAKGFESDRWHGYEHTLAMVYWRLFDIEHKRFPEHYEAPPKV